MSKRSLRAELDRRGRYVTVAGTGATMAAHPNDPDYPEVDLRGMTADEAAREAQRYYDANIEAARLLEHEEQMRDEQFAAAWIVANLTVAGYLD